MECFVEGLKKTNGRSQLADRSHARSGFPESRFYAGVFAQVEDVRAALRALPAAAARAPKSETRVTTTMGAVAVQTGTILMPAAEAPREAGGDRMLHFL
ncbi:MAG: hypothetical protein HEQ37_00670 [Acidovorax sp.]|nr:hypothetical protein [Acidovorax sp.]